MKSEMAPATRVPLKSTQPVRKSASARSVSVNPGSLDCHLGAAHEALRLVEPADVHQRAGLCEEGTDADTRPGAVEVDIGERNERLTEAAGVAVLFCLGHACLAIEGHRLDDAQVTRRGDGRER